MPLNENNIGAVLIDKSVYVVSTDENDIYYGALYVDHDTSLLRYSVQKEGEEGHSFPDVIYELILSKEGIKALKTDWSDDGQTSEVTTVDIFDLFDRVEKLETKVNNTDFIIAEGHNWNNGTHKSFKFAVTPTTTSLVVSDGTSNIKSSDFGLAGKTWNDPSSIDDVFQVNPFTNYVIRVGVDVTELTFTNQDGNIQVVSV